MEEDEVIDRRIQVAPTASFSARRPVGNRPLGLKRPVTNSLQLGDGVKVKILPNRVHGFRQISDM